MPDAPTSSRRDGWTVGPAKTGAAGFLGGAAVVGMIWAITTRGPTQAPPPGATPVPANAAALVQAFSADTASPPTTVPTAPAAQAPEPAGTAPPEPAPAAVTELLEPIELPAPDPDPGAFPVSDGSRPPPKPDPAPPAPEPTTAALRVDVNHAAAPELELLPGVGPVLAARIIEDRAAHGPFRSIDDLQRVRGIGAKTAEKLRPLVTFH